MESYVVLKRDFVWLFTNRFTKKGFSQNLKKICCATCSFKKMFSWISKLTVRGSGQQKNIYVPDCAFLYIESQVSAFDYSSRIQIHQTFAPHAQAKNDHQACKITAYSRVCSTSETCIVSKFCEFC